MVEISMFHITNWYAIFEISASNKSLFLLFEINPRAFLENVLIHALMSGNIEIGNGYGVPGGGAYYGAQKPNIDTPSKSKELPDYLKQKLKARGILKDDTEKGSPVSTNYVSLTYLWFGLIMLF